MSSKKGAARREIATVSGKIFMNIKQDSRKREKKNQIKKLSTRKESVNKTKGKMAEMKE